METSPANPFRGLTPYGEKDRAWLFGRDKDVVLMQSRIFSGRTTLLFAGSGVGKTSFLNAKVMPELEEQFEIFYHNEWSGGVEPLEAVLTSIYKKIIERYPEQSATEQQRLAATPQTGDERPNALISALKISNAAASISGKSKPNGSLLILDQFEEVFQYHAYEDYFKTFLDSVCDLINNHKQQTHLIFSMREEFLGELSVFDSRIPDLFSNYYRLKYPDQQGAQDIISRTTQRAHVTADETRLVQLVKDLSKIEKVSASAAKLQADGEKGAVRFVERDIVAPPYLQIACRKLWERQFSSTNGAASAGIQFLSTYKPDDARAMLREFISEKLSSLNSEEQNLASRSFDFLVTKQGAKMAYELSQLADHMGVNEKKLEKTLQKLSAPETRILRESGSTGNHWFELYHDMYGTIVDEWKEDYHRRQRKKVKKTVAGILVAALLGVVLVSLYFFLSYRSQTTFIAKGQAHTLEQLAGNYEITEGRDEVLLKRLEILNLKGIDEETQNKNYAEIKRLISDDYPLLLMTYQERNANKTVRAMFSAGGQEVLTQDVDGTIRLWEAETGKKINIPVEWSEPPLQTQPSADGKTASDAPKLTQGTEKSSNASKEVLQSQKKTVSQNRLGAPEQTVAPRQKMLPTDAIIRAVVKHPIYQFLIAGTEKGLERKEGFKLYIWRADNGQLLGEPTPLSADFLTVNFKIVFSPDANFIAAQAQSKSPVIWKIADDKLFPNTEIKSDSYVTYVAFSPDSKYLLTTGDKSNLWDLSSSQSSWSIPDDQRITGASFSAAGGKLLTVSSSGNIKIWDLQTRTEIDTGIKNLFHSPGQIVPHFAEDNGTVISQDREDSLVFWDAQTGIQREEMFRVHGAAIRYDVHPQAHRVLSLSDGVARLWKLTPRKPDGKLIRLNNDITDESLSPDGTKLITVNFMQDPQPYDIKAEQSIGAPQRGKILNSDFSYQLSTNESEHNNVHIWDTSTQQELARFIYRPLNVVLGFDVSPDRQFLYVKFSDSNYTSTNYFMALKINEDKSCVLLSNPIPYDASGDASGKNAQLVFSPDSKYIGVLLKYQGASTLTVFDLPSMNRISIVAGLLPSNEDSYHYPVFSNDGKLVAEVAGNQVALWELPIGRLLHTLTYSSTITAFKFTPDNKNFVTGNEDGTVIFWDVGTAAQTVQANHGNAVRQIEFNPAGDYLIVATDSWVHLSSLSNIYNHLASRMIESRWINPFRLINTSGSTKIRFLLGISHNLLKIQDIDFNAHEEIEEFEGDPQTLLKDWRRRLNRNSEADSGTTGGGF